MCRGKSMGAYTGSHGIDLIRKHVAAYIEKRDGHGCDFNNICLTAGASVAIKYTLELFCNDPCKKTGTSHVFTNLLLSYTNRQTDRRRTFGAQ